MYKYIYFYIYIYWNFRLTIDHAVCKEIVWPCKIFSYHLVKKKSQALKKIPSGNSLVVQGMPVWSLIRELRSPYGAEQLSCHTKIPEAHVLWIPHTELLNPHHTTGEAMPCNETLCQMQQSSYVPQLRPNTAKYIYRRNTYTFPLQKKIFKMYLHNTDLL